MKKLDLKKELKQLYQPSAKDVAVVDVPAMNLLMIDGAGDPNHSKAYAEGIEALFAVSYTIKFMVKRGPLAVDYGVMPLEGLWWADDRQDSRVHRSARQFARQAPRDLLERYSQGCSGQMEDGYTPANGGSGRRLRK